MFIAVLVVLVLWTAGIKDPWSACVYFAALVAQRAVSAVVLPSGNTETEESRHVYRIPRTAVRVRVQACIGNTDEVKQERVESRTKEYSEFTGVACCCY